MTNLLASLLFNCSKTPSMKKLLLALIVATSFSACNNLKQNDNGAKEPEPVSPASEVKNDSATITADTTSK